MFPTTKWSIDLASSKLTFAVNSHKISLSGQFARFDGTVHTTGDDFSTAKIDFSVDADSISTGNKNRDQYLIDKDFFDVIVFPQITFVSDSIKETDKTGIYKLSGTLTIKGLTKPVTLIVRSDNNIQNPVGTDEAFFEVSATMNLKNWSLNWLSFDSHDTVVSEIALNCEIHLIKCEQPTRKETVSAELDNAVPAEYIL